MLDIKKVEEKSLEILGDLVMEKITQNKFKPAKKLVTFMRENTTMLMDVQM